MRRFVSTCIGPLSAVLLTLFATGTLHAQLNRATITGTVTDSSGAVVPDVDVAVTNVGTHVVTHSHTNGDGIYSVLDLFPGKYSVSFNKTGFQPLDLPEITLESTQVAKIDEVLAIGAVAQAVQVTTQAPILDAETATEGTHLSGQVITDLPLNVYGGRQVETFAQMLTPGYSPQSNPYTAVINGNQVFTKDYTVDGTSGTAQIQGDSMETAPTMEAIQEVQSETAGIEPQNGITNGGVIMLNLKSGTNQFHGSAFDYWHNEILDARVWGNPDKPENRFWDYGGSLGGPILKNKTFFFAAFERYSQVDYTLGTLGNGSGVTVPTAAMLQGDFSALLNTSDKLGTDKAGNPIYAGAIFNPNTGTVFPNNMIPASMISPVSQKIIALYQKDYAPQSTSLVGNERFPTTNSPSQTPDQAVLKLDHNLTDRNRLSGSWIYDYRPRVLADSGGVWEDGSTTGGPLADVRQQMVIGHQWRASDSWTISPTLLNIFNATYNNYWNGSVPAESGTNWNSQLGFGDTGAENFPAINFGGAVNGVQETAIGNTWQGHYVANTFIYGDNLSWMKGKHQFTFGGDFRAMQNNYHGGSGALSFNFNPSTTGDPSASFGNQVGFGFASFLLGDAQTGTETTPEDLYARRKAMDLFAQDSWKVTPKLTVNIGLRWDATFRLHEKYGHWSDFDMSAVDPTLGIPGEVVYANNGSVSFEKNEDWHNFGPSIGLAWNPWKKFVFRGGFDILYVPIGIQYWQGIPYGPDMPGYHGLNNAAAPFNWNSGYPGVYTPPSQPSTLPENVLMASIDPNSLEAGYTDNWNLGVQYEISQSMRLEVAYIANRGHHLQDSTLWNNQTTGAEFMSLAKSGNALNYVCSPSQAAANGVPYPYAGFCAPALAAVAPFPQAASAEANYWFYPDIFRVGYPAGQSYYDSFVVQFIKRLGAGLTMDLNYTHSRSEGDVYSNFGDSYDTVGVQDIYNLAEAAHTLGIYDQKHVVKGAVTYELPFGSGRQFLSGAHGFVNALIGGWRVSGLVNYATGLPLGFSSTNYYWYPLWGETYVDFNLSGYNGPEFNRGSFQIVTNSSNPPGVDRYFPSTIATNPPYGSFGTGPARIDALRDFGQAIENASLMKNTAFGPEGRFRLQLRIEFYNIFNRHQFATPITDLNSPEFGFVPGINTGYPPRNGQFGLRFEF